MINQLTEENIEELYINEIELGESKQTPIFTPIDTPILHKRFEKQVMERGDEIALVASDETLSIKN